MNLSFLSLTDQRDLIKSREINASELADACYRQIERLNPTLNAFITVIPPEQLSAQEETQSGLLQEIPIAVKDLYNTKGIRTTAGTRFFADHIPQEDAYVVQKIKKAWVSFLSRWSFYGRL